MANQYTYTLDSGADIYLDISGDLVIEGRERPELRVTGDDLKVQVSEDLKRADISGEDDCRLSVSATAKLHIGSLGGDVEITNVDGPIDIASVDGDLEIRDCATFNINAVSGDVEVWRIEGEVTMDDVGGDAEFHYIGSELRVDTVGGDVMVKDAEKLTRIDIETIGGDLVFDTEISPDVVCKFSTVGGDVRCKIPADANVTFRIPRHVEHSVEIPGVKIVSDDH